MDTLKLRLSAAAIVGDRIGSRSVRPSSHAWEDVPADLAQAALMLAAHYHEYRDATALDGGCMPFGVSALIERYRPLRLSGALA